jgi:hypothetical protein
VTATPPKTNGVSHEEHSILPSPSPEAVTPQRGTSEAPAGAVSRSESRPTESKSFGDAKESVYKPATSGGIKSTVSAAAAGVANAVPTSSADLQNQLSEAKATINKLRQQLDTSSGLRQRKGEPTSDSKAQLATAERVQAPAGGVPVQIVAGLCLISFLLAYFFF